VGGAVIGPASPGKGLLRAPNIGTVTEVTGTPVKDPSNQFVTLRKIFISK
jgi:hypothetical protein